MPNNRVSTPKTERDECCHAGPPKENPLNNMFDDLDRAIVEQEIRNVDDDWHASVTDALLSIRDILRVFTGRDK